MNKIAAMLAVSVLLAGCSDHSAARRALEAQGYTDIEITGYKMFGCGRDDTFRTGFRAVSQAGVLVEGVVCSDWYKGATVRTF